MKIEARVKFCDKLAKELGIGTVCVDVDADYVTNSETEVKDWVANELEDITGKSLIRTCDFEVTNMEDILSDIAFDEFERKTQYSNM